MIEAGKRSFHAHSARFKLLKCISKHANENETGNHSLNGCLAGTTLLQTVLGKILQLSLGVSLGFQANMEGQLCKVWDGLYVSSRTDHSTGAKLCDVVSAPQSVEIFAILSISVQI